ncbi:YkgJ family cysteine cluster protein [Magnetococcales bacterium HHB-1]
MADEKQVQQKYLRDIEMDDDTPPLPNEVRDILDPVRLTEKETFKFRCYPGISCFNHCCKNIEIILTPFDIIRLRRRLDNISAERFLYNYATPTTLRKGQLPVPIIRMDEKTGRCPFNTDAGCAVYEDRPVTCRYYPIGMALMRKQKERNTDEFYFLIKEDFCKGHCEEQTWSVKSWRVDQGTDGFDLMNKNWIDMILRRRSAGDTVSTSQQLSEFFYMGSTNPEQFRRFIFNSTFLKRYQLDEETLEQIKEDDEALTIFALDWLQSVVFGKESKHIRMTKEAKEILDKRKTSKLLQREAKEKR